MAPEWTTQIPNYAICNFFYAFYVVYAVIFAFAVLQIVYIFAVVKKFDLSHGVILGSGFFTMALALVLTLFHYLVCDRALMDKAIEDVEGFAIKASTTQVAAAKKTSTAQTKAGTTGKAPVKCPAGCVP
jgi:uncharacterized membrane protein YcgQ (UPF0703/DUF1980 family)